MKNVASSHDGFYLMVLMSCVLGVSISNGKKNYHHNSVN